MTADHTITGLGVNVVLKHHTNRALAQYVSALTGLGCRWIRLKLAFNRLGPASKEWQVVDRFIALCHKHKLEILGLLSPYIPGTIGNLLWPRLNHRPVLEQLPAYQRYLNTCLTRYHSVIKHWEVWNEPNFVRFWISWPNASEYLGLLKLTHHQIKEHDPQARVVLGGLCIGNLLPFIIDWEKFYQQILDLGGGDYFEIANIHPYSRHSYFSFDSPARLTRHFPRLIRHAIRRFQTLSSSHPVWITEFGISPAWVWRLKPKDIARIYYRCYAAATSLNVPLALWNLTDFGDRYYLPGNPERNFGLLDWKLQPKPVYAQLLALLNQ
jgi:hypothetical protein